MGNRCKTKNCTERKFPGFDYCEFHLKGVTKNVVKEAFFDSLRELDFSEVILFPSDIKIKDYGIDSIDMAEVVMLIEDKLNCDIPYELIDTFDEHHSLNECLDGLSDYFILSKNYIGENVSANYPTNLSNYGKLDFILSDKIYEEAFTELSLNKNEIADILKKLLIKNNILYVTAIPNDNADGNLKSLEMFILTQANLFVYSFMNRKIDFKIINRLDLNLDYEFLFSENGEIIEILLFFKTKSYLPYQEKTFSFKGDYSIDKTMIFLSKFSKEYSNELTKRT